MTHRVITAPVRIPVPGGKLIEEIVGRVATGHTSLSVAHMVAPSGWGEPAQTPEFLEVTVMVRGTMRIEIGAPGAHEVVELAAGQSIVIEPGVRVRYSNPYDAENEYYAVCLPAFSPETAKRDE
jgi:mannose-6-phosphate isomerase-like protein (cupin superfamily)